MGEWLTLAWVLLVGMVLGLFFFGGLWLTLRQLATRRSPGLLLLVSFVLRSAITLAGFYWVMAGRWERAVVLVIGFLVARLLAVRTWGIGDKGIPHGTESG